MAKRLATMSQVGTRGLDSFLSEEVPTQRCYCESRGELIYCSRDDPPHEVVSNLPQPEVSQLQRRPKSTGSANLQFLDQNEGTLSSRHYLEEFKLTVEADGLTAALKGILFYNPYTQKLNTYAKKGYGYVQQLMPQQVSEYLSGWFHQEIRHRETAGLITDFAWHPKFKKIAVALKDDTIKVWYGENGALSPLLKHKRQVGINILRWKPLVDDILAVGCLDCCILWTVDPTSLSARPGSGCAQIISSPSNQPVHSLTWDPKDSLLALASKKSTKIEIWDADREELILRKGGLSCIATAAFNPSGEKLLVSGQNSITVFTCSTWTSETWKDLKGTVQLVQWSNDGDRFIFADSNELFCIRFDRVLGGDTRAELVATFDADISQLAWHNERLTVGLDGAGTQLRLYNTQLDPAGSLRVEFIGWIPCLEKAELISIRENVIDGHNFGSILSMVYPTGEMENVPLLYVDKNSHPTRRAIPKHLETDTSTVYTLDDTMDIF